MGGGSESYGWTWERGQEMWSLKGRPRGEESKMPGHGPRTPPRGREGASTELAQGARADGFEHF